MASHLVREDVPFDILRSEEEPVDALAACDEAVAVPMAVVAMIRRVIMRLVRV